MPKISLHDKRLRFSEGHFVNKYIDNIVIVALTHWGLYIDA